MQALRSLTVQLDGARTNAASGLASVKP